MKNLILIGGGGHCKSVIDVAESAGYTILGILDRSIPVGDTVLGYKVLGNDDLIGPYLDKAEFLVTVGQIKSPDIRIRLNKIVKDAGGKLAIVIAPSAHLSKYASLGEGTVVMHQAVVNAGAQIGMGCIVNTFSNIEHDVKLGDYCHISTGAMVNGEAEIGEGSFIGSQSVVNQCVKVCNMTVVASGSVVHKDITEAGVYAGNPIKRVK